MNGRFLTSLFCKTSYIALFLNIANINNVNAKAIITNLAEETELLQTLREYKVHDNHCDKYLNRYAVIKNIEYYDFKSKFKESGVPKYFKMKSEIDAKKSKKSKKNGKVEKE